MKMWTKKKKIEITGRLKIQYSKVSVKFALSIFNHPSFNVVVFIFQTIFRLHWVRRRRCFPRNRTEVLLLWQCAGTFIQMRYASKKKNNVEITVIFVVERSCLSVCNLIEWVYTFGTSNAHFNSTLISFNYIVHSNDTHNFTTVKLLEKTWVITKEKQSKIT